MNLNEFSLTFYGRHWVQLNEKDRKDAYERHHNLTSDFSDIFTGLFGGPRRK